MQQLMISISNSNKLCDVLNSMDASFDGMKGPEQYTYTFNAILSIGHPLNVWCS